MHSHNLTCAVIPEDQGNNKICADYIIGSKYKQSFYQIKHNNIMKEHVTIFNVINSVYIK